MLTVDFIGDSNLPRPSRASYGVPGELLILPNPSVTHLTLEVARRHPPLGHVTGLALVTIRS
jgi:hypothetical protein